MSFQVHVRFAMLDWRLSRRFLGDLQDCLGLRGFKTDRARPVLGDSNLQEALARPGASSLESVPLDPMPEKIFFDAFAKDGPTLDFKIYVPSADQVRDDESWPVYLDVSDKTLLHFRDHFSVESLAKHLHLCLGATKTLAITDPAASSEELQAAYAEVAHLYQGDPMLDPIMDFLIFDPTPYGEGLVDRLGEIYRRFAEALSEPPPEPFPAAMEKLSNGHIFLQARPLI